MKLAEQPMTNTTIYWRQKFIDGMNGQVFSEYLTKRLFEILNSDQLDISVEYFDCKMIVIKGDNEVMELDYSATVRQLCEIF